MRGVSLLLLLAAGLVSTGCADFYSISRHTTLPAHSANNGLAIHLDAQQRLVLVGPDGKYCAEASPDAMAAYAAALALGVSIPGAGSGSSANASNSDIASIGLRTQSITLMRDALYRLCEATANGTVSPLSATQLLARSQDLTAVVVAVEQLTGAVAANQAILTNSSNASASASLMSDAQLAAQARDNVTQKTADLATAKQEQTEQATKVETQKTTTADADKAYQDAKNAETPPSNLADLQATATNEDNNLTSAQADLQVDDAKVKNAQANLDDANRALAAIQNSNSAALTQATAGTSGNGQFSAPVPRIQLDADGTEQVARSVEGMVNTVLNKDYTTDACLTMLTNVTEFDRLSEDQKKYLQGTLDQCSALLNAKIHAETAKILMTASYAPPTADVDRVEKAMAADKTLLPRLNAWLATKGNITVADVETDPKYADLMKEMITAFEIR